MKKILISAFVLVLGVGVASAQGPWFLQGNIGLDFTKQDKNKNTEFNIRPGVGYMFNDNWGVTIDLGYGYNKLETTTGTGETATTSERKTQTLGLGIGAVYFCNIAGNFYYAPNVRVGYARETEGKTNIIGADLNLLGFEFRPSNHWGLNVNFGGLGYTNTKTKDVDAINHFSLNVFQNTNVGVRFYF